MGADLTHDRQYWPGHGLGLLHSPVGVAGDTAALPAETLPTNPGNRGHLTVLLLCHGSSWAPGSRPREGLPQQGGKGLTSGPQDKAPVCAQLLGRDESEASSWSQAGLW